MDHDSRGDPAPLPALTPAEVLDAYRDAPAAYRQVFDASPDYVSISRVSDGLFIDVNAGFEQFTGYRRHEVVGRSAFDIGLWPSADERTRYVRAVLGEGGCRNFTCGLRRRDGTVRQVEASANVAHVNAELVVVSVVRDVTERIAAEQQLQRYRDELEQLVTERTAALSRALDELARAHAQLKRTHSRLQLSEQQSRRQAHHDQLTGLPNRLLLSDRLSRALARAQRTGETMALLFVDLDDFKQVNDRLGHAAGDELLRTLAARLLGCVRRSDTVARLGGDEFVLLISGLHAADDAARVAEKALAALQEPVALTAGEARVSGSIGIAVWPQDGEDVETLVEAADAAMYRAKTSGARRYCFHSPKG